MAFRFCKRVKLFPSVSVNLSKAGVTPSVGVPGATVNIGSGKTRTTVGLPGSGLSYTSTNTSTSTTPTTTAGPAVRPLVWVLLVLGVIGTLYALAM